MSTKGGRRDPNSKREAQRLHPEDWERISEPAAGHTTGMLREGLKREIGAHGRVAGRVHAVLRELSEREPGCPSAAIGKLFTNEGTSLRRRSAAIM